MADRPLPYELSHFNNLSDLTYRGNNEWSSACPKCGGGGNRYDKSDRFRLFAAVNGTNARVWCRQCNYFEWADQQQGIQPDPARIQEAQELRAKLAEQEVVRLRSKIQELREAAYWQGWHDAMGEQQRQLWREQGIADSLQDWFKLGYTPKHTFGDGERLFERPAMTIPHFDVGWQAVNVQYRIMNPPPGAGKYRYTAGLPAPLYLTDPDQEPEGATIIVEGAKKAIVLFAHLGHKFTITAVPSKAPSAALLDRLVNCDPVYIVLDPDAYVGGRTRDGGIVRPAVNRLARMLGNRARVVKLPVKPDDLFTRLGCEVSTFNNYLRLARVA